MKKEILLLRGQLKNQNIPYRQIGDQKLLSMIGNSDYEIEGQEEKPDEENFEDPKWLKTKRQSLNNLNESEVIMKYLELRAKFDNLLESAGKKIGDLNDQVSSLNTESISKETIDKLKNS